MARLPPETCDMIIDCLRQDKRALAVCGMVCRCWLPRSRNYLFHRVSLYPKNAHRFVDLLSSPSRTFTSYVHTLRLEEGRGMTPSIRQWIDELLPYMKGLLDVEWLHIHGLKWEDLGTAARNSLKTLFPNLTRLHLWQVSFATIDEMMALVYGHARLETICLDVVSWNCGPLPSEETRSLTSSLKSLHLGSCFKDVIFEWLLRHRQTYSNVQELYLETLSAQERPGVARFIQNLGPSLKHLDIPIINLPNCRDALLRDIHLGSNTELQSITFSGISPPNQQQLTVVLFFLAQVTSPSLRNLKFTLWVNNPSYPDSGDWTAIARILAHATFANLRSIDFSIRGGGRIDRENIAKLIREGLRGRAERGMLRFLL